MKKYKRNALVLALCALLALSPLPRSAGEDKGETAVFSELSEQEQTELLAGAIALLTESGESYVVRLTIGGILLDRMASPFWGDTLWEVVEPLTDASEHLPEAYDEGALAAAKAAILGLRPVPGAMYFGKGEAPDGVEAAASFGGYWFQK